MTHEEKVIAYCSEHGSITVRDAFLKLFINSPTKVISNIRKSGKYAVSTVREHAHCSDAVYNRYFIIPVKEVS